ncbi:hypothetical protein SAMN02910400_01317 [Lachnospiraceae bacterium C10]|nr:hypothetical protein SAMN02910400_01317 [Lachnospiraceae bacterium C10]
MRLIFGFLVGRNGFKGIAISEVSAWIGAFMMLMVTYYCLTQSEKSPTSKR